MVARPRRDYLVMQGLEFAVLRFLVALSDVERSGYELLDRCTFLSEKVQTRRFRVKDGTWKRFDHCSVTTGNRSILRR
jgi:hypothetical protein